MKQSFSVLGWSFIHFNVSLVIPVHFIPFDLSVSSVKLCLVHAHCYEGCCSVIRVWFPNINTTTLRRTFVTIEKLER